MVTERTAPPAGMANVSGKLVLPDGAPALNSKVKFELVYAGGNLGRVLSTGTIISTEPFLIDVADDGTWATQLYGNDVIVCGIDDTGPSRWRISYIVNGDELPSTDYQINSGANPFTPDDAPICTLPPGNINCAVDYPYVTPPPPPIAGPQGPPGPPGPQGDPSATMQVSWVPGVQSSTAWLGIGDAPNPRDTGATAAVLYPGATANARVQMSGTRRYDGRAFLFGGRNFTFKCIADVHSFTGNTTFSAVGVADDVTWGISNSYPPVGNFVLFKTSGGNWQCSCGDGSSTTTVNTSVSSLARHNLEIDFTPTSVNFLIDGTIVATITTHVPNAGQMWLVFASGDNLTAEYLFGSQSSV